MLWMGPGIKAGSTLDFPGTQVDHAPTILGLAGIDTPNYMDGVSIVPLLVRRDTAEAQGQRLPGSVEEHLRRTAAPPKRVASYHTYYNQGPWFTGCDPGDPVAGSWCERKAVAPYDRHRLDDWSNTCRGGMDFGKFSSGWQIILLRHTGDFQKSVLLKRSGNVFVC